MFMRSEVWYIKNNAGSINWVCQTALTENSRKRGLQLSFDNVDKIDLYDVFPVIGIRIISNNSGHALKKVAHIPF